MADKYLCTECQKKTASHIPSHCIGRPSGNQCPNVTLSTDFKLCDECANKFDQCKWCLNPLKGGTGQSSIIPAGTFFAVARNDDKDTTLTTLAVGEYVRVELTEDRWSGKVWGIKSLSPGLTHVGTQEIMPDPSNWQIGLRRFFIKIGQQAVKTTAEIQIEEVSRWWFTIKSPQKWGCKVQVD